MDDPYAAFCFDSAVATFGQALDGELQAVEGKKKSDIENKQRRILERWIPEFKEAGTQRFRDPMEKMNNAQL